MKDTPEDKIHAFCTVDPSEMEREGDQIICTKCSREMANLDANKGEQPSRSGARSKGFLCGVIFAAALSSCATNSEVAPDGEGQPCDGSAPPGEEEIPLPGVYYGSIKAPVDFEYPNAKPVEGEPGIVESPYGGHRVDVSRIPPGSLVIDPNFSVESEKYFRI
jgi:hypothetical protein